MKREDVVLSKISQSGKDKYEVPTAVKFMDTESTMVTAGGWGRGVQEVGLV